MRRDRKNGFTLIEMLTVIVIIGIVIGLAIPAVTNLMKSGGLSTASRHVTNQLSLARQYAITHRMNTRVVFPYQSTPINSQAPRYLSYAIVANNNGAWQYVGKWEQLPLGVVFLKNNPPTTVGGTLEKLQIDSSIPFPNAGGALASLAYIEFAPTGAATQTGTLAYQEGIINGSGFPQITSTANFATNVIDNLIGRVQLFRPS